jgi:hypothetical protein
MKAPNPEWITGRSSAGVFVERSGLSWGSAIGAGLIDDAAAVGGLVAVRNTQRTDGDPTVKKGKLSPVQKSSRT